MEREKEKGERRDHSRGKLTSYLRVMEYPIFIIIAIRSVLNSKILFFLSTMIPRQNTIDQKIFFTIYCQCHIRSIIQLIMRCQKYINSAMRVETRKKLVTSVCDPTLVINKNIIINQNDIYALLLLLVSAGLQALVTSSLRVSTLSFIELILSVTVVKCLRW